MNLKNQIEQRRYRRRGPLGTICGLLTACLVTLIGLANGHDPFVILCRSCVSAFLMGLVVWFGLSVISIANTSRA